MKINKYKYQSVILSIEKVIMECYFYFPFSIMKGYVSTYIHIRHVHYIIKWFTDLLVEESNISNKIHSYILNKHH